MDANVLLYAVNVDAPRHTSARAWLDNALNGESTVHFSWVALLAFVRLTTREGLFPHPLTTDEAFDRVDAWLAQPTAVIATPGPDHAHIMRRILGQAGTGGNLVNDAHLAALSIERQCPIVSFDNDFDRFPGVDWFPPPTEDQ
ncbi:MAG: type II toxin-antitoxin system VapC family toxin [Candidatus Nanopelagicales bacterium]